MVYSRATTSAMAERPLPLAGLEADLDLGAIVAKLNELAEVLKGGLIVYL